MSYSSKEHDPLIDSADTYSRYQVPLFKGCARPDLSSASDKKGCARCGQREFVPRAVVPPILAPQEPAAWASAGSPGLEWARRAPLMLMMRVPAVRIMRSRPRASSNLLALHRAVSQANFEFPRPCQRPCRGAHHQHQRDPGDFGGGARKA